MNDRKILVLIGIQAATLLAIAALIIMGVLQHGEAVDEARRIAAEIRDTREARYEYKVLSFVGDGNDRTGDEAIKLSTITPDEAELTALGSAGWEVVSSYLEMETAFPNFGRADYVTGLQPNVRPQRLVVVLRRRVA